jgi:hypothetical protein
MPPRGQLMYYFILTKLAVFSVYVSNTQNCTEWLVNWGYIIYCTVAGHVALKCHHAAKL